MTAIANRSRYIPWLFVGGFALVVAVNATMIWFAVGVLLRPLYREAARPRPALQPGAGQAAAARCAGLARRDGVAARSGRLEIAVFDAEGRPLAPSRLTAELVRPVKKRLPIGVALGATRLRPLRGLRRPPGARQLGSRHRGRARQRTLCADTADVPEMTDVALFAPTQAATTRCCAHCGDVVRAGDAPFCCAGCASAHAIIGAAGLDGFYRRLEDRHARRPAPLDVDFADHARLVGNGEAELDLLVDGLDCAACVWLIESLLARNPAIVRARVQLSTRRLSLRWRGPAADANAHAGLVAALGFRLAPYDAATLAGADDREARDLLRCLAVAGFAAANVMLLSVAVWSGHDGSMGEATRTLFHFLSAAHRPAGHRLCRPAVLPLGHRRTQGRTHQHGRADLDRRHSGLDRQPARGVGRRAACLLRFGDHAALLPADRPLSRPACARPGARRRCAPCWRSTSRSATVIEADGSTAARRVDRLRPGDMLLVAAGERLAADGVVTDGRSTMDSALVSGESVPQSVAPGAGVFAGMVNLGAPVRVRVAGRRRTHAALRDRAPGRSGRARPLALRRLGGSRRARLCARRACDGAAHLPGLDAFRRPRLGSRPAGRHRRADHHLSLRPGAGGAGGPGRGQHAAAAPRRAAALADGAGAHRAHRPCRARQDRHPDARPA